MICVSVGRTRHAKMIEQHQALAEVGVELVELRVDWLKRLPDVSKLLGERPTPTVFTCRRREDRGMWRGSEEQRRTLLRAAIVAGVEYVDLEADIAKQVPRYGETKRIVSHHDFEQTPANIAEIHSQLCECDPDIVKLVTFANSPVDAARMLQLVRDSKVPTIGFCMGELGQFSRVLCGRFGAPFTYASFSREREMAPGQIAFDEMRDLYRYDNIGPETKVFGVLGDPIAHSYSPLLHNKALQNDDVNAVYLPFRVPAHQLNESLAAFNKLRFQGFSVTIPHKEAVLSFANTHADQVTACGAANTLSVTSEGSWQAENTDYGAAMSTLESALLEKEPDNNANLAGKRVLILGAGGVSKAIAHGVKNRGGIVTITNRTRARGEELAQQVGCQFQAWGNRGAEHADVLINCTPIGMHPNVDETPFADNWIMEGSVVFDTIYNPENTLLIKRARERGCTIASGLEMFVRQAAAQYERFTQRSAPLDVFRKTLRRAMSPVKY